ncbi:MAG: hypothetical protein AAF519_14460 [Bacteroidota bacterium]
MESKTIMNNKIANVRKQSVKNVWMGLAFFGVLFLVNCSGADDPAPAVERELGYVLYTFGEGNFITSSDTLFTGTVSVTDLTNSIQVAGNARGGGKAFNGSFYAGVSPSGDPGIQKYTRDETGTLQEDGFISITQESPFDFSEATKGYYVDITRSTTALQIFDPSTMQRTGQIDYPEEVTKFNTGDVANISLSLVQVSGDYVFTQIGFRESNGTVAYDSTFVVAINTNTDTFEELMIYPKAYGFSSGARDTNGDLYLRGGVSNPPLGVASTELARIKSGATAFDLTFGTEGIFGFRDIIENPGTGSGIVLTMGEPLVQDGKLYMRIFSDEVIGTDAFTSENIDGYVVDMNAETGSKIQEIPSSSFATNSLEGPKLVDDLVYFPISKNDFQGYYTYDPITGAVNKAITLEGIKPAAFAKLELTE